MSTMNKYVYYGGGIAAAAAIGFALGRATSSKSSDADSSKSSRDDSKGSSSHFAQGDGDEPHQRLGVDPELWEQTRKEAENYKHGESKRILIVNKNLPVKITRSTDGTWNVEWGDERDPFANLKILKETTGMEVKFIGCPSVNIDDDDEDSKDSLEEELMKYDCIPVWLPEKVNRLWYKGFCKGILWPLLHYVTPQSNQQFGERWLDLWQQYKTASLKFSKVIACHVKSLDDIVWIHNYHLLLLPSFLRHKLQHVKIGLFIHTPFPSSDVFRMLPGCENIIRGIMSADLVGFHTFDYARHFLSLCKRVLDLDFETMSGGTLGIRYSGRVVSILINHVGIDANFFTRAANEEKQVIERVAQLRQENKNRVIILGIDDLDLVKGSLLKIQAYRKFLTEHPDWVDKVTMLQILLPSSNNPAHKQLVREAMLAEIKAIHEDFGPDVFQLRQVDSLSKFELIALYRSARVAVVSTFWDGLNLAPLEYTVSQDPKDPGALVISEFMGCSRSLSGVQRVNPWDLQQVSESMMVAVSMTLAERQFAHKRRSQYIHTHNHLEWCKTFLHHLESAARMSKDLSFISVGWGSKTRLVGLRSDFMELEEQKVAYAFRPARKRVILLDYDGTLTPPDEGKIKNANSAGPSDAVLSALELLCEDPDNYVFILSGRGRAQMQRWFGHIEEIGIAAEKGVFLRWPARVRDRCRQKHATTPPLLSLETGPSAVFEHDDDVGAFDLDNHENSNNDSNNNNNKKKNNNKDEKWRDDWECLWTSGDFSWKEQVITVLQEYCKHVDGSWVEPKETAVVWHYENADPEYGRMQATEIERRLLSVIDNPNVGVSRYDFNRLLEAKPAKMNKGLTTSHILNQLSFVGPDAERDPTGHGPSSFFLAIGDDRSDEAMFLATENRHDEKTKGKKQLVGERESNTFTCCVGIKPSCAHYYLVDDRAVVSLLESLAQTSSRLRELRQEGF